MNALRVAALLSVLVIAPSRAEETNALPTKITIGFETFEDVAWGTVTPVSVSIRHRTGIATIPMEKLPTAIQKQLGYDPQKAADYQAALQRAEAARQEAKQKQWAAGAAERERQAQLQEQQRQAAEAAATKNAAEAAAKKAEEAFSAKLGPVTMIKFTNATNVKTLPNGNCTANLWYTDDVGQWGNIYVEFPPIGLNFIRNTRLSTNPNAFVVYGRPYAADLQNRFGATSTDTAYWLVGVRLTGWNNTPAW
jgi:hypothetical protein